MHAFLQHGTCITSWKPILLQMLFTCDAKGLIHRVSCQTMLPASFSAAKGMADLMHKNANYAI
jgi:hypothetical protein